MSRAARAAIAALSLATASAAGAQPSADHASSDPDSVRAPSRDSATSQRPKRSRRAIWVNTGVGTDVKLEDVGYAANLTVETIGRQIAVVRLQRLGEFCLLCEDAGRRSEVGLLYGIATHPAEATIAVAAGVSRTATRRVRTPITVDGDDFIVVHRTGVPLELQIFARPSATVGIGVTAAIDLRDTSLPAAVFAGLQFGRLPPRRTPPTRRPRLPL